MKMQLNRIDCFILAIAVNSPESTYSCISGKMTLSVQKRLIFSMDKKLPSKRKYRPIDHLPPDPIEVQVSLPTLWVIIRQRLRLLITILKKISLFT